MWTSQATPVYGGRWDAEAAEYVGEAEEILHLPCSPPQFECLESRAAITEFSGGRGVGKSQSGLLLAVANICDRPFVDGRFVSPTAELYRVQWDKLLPLLLGTGWLLPGEAGIRESKHELWFHNGVCVQFRSAHKPDRLRSWGGGWAILDEAQDIKSKAVQILLFCLREGGDRFQLHHQLTPAPGEALERHDEHLKIAAERPGDVAVLAADSYQNPFISHKVFDLAKRSLDQVTCDIEIGGSWEAVRATLDAGRVVYGLKRDVHGITWPPATGIDITAEVTKERTGYPREWVAGVDYNWDYPNYASMLKVLAGVGEVEWGTRISDLERKRLIKAALDDHRLQHWCLVDIVTSKGHAGALGAEIKARDYDQRKVLVIDDASGQFNRGKNSKNSSSRLMRDQGFTVLHPNRNPSIRDAVNALNAKISPVDGSTSFHVVLPQCEEFAEAADHCLWDTSGAKLDKTTGHDHVIQGTYYPIAYFCPAARISSSLRALTLR